MVLFNYPFSFICWRDHKAPRQYLLLKSTNGVVWFTYSQMVWQQLLYWINDKSLVWNNYNHCHLSITLILASQKKKKKFIILNSVRSSAGMSNFIQPLHLRNDVREKLNHAPLDTSKWYYWGNQRAFGRLYDLKTMYIAPSHGRTWSYYQSMSLEFRYDFENVLGTQNCPTC